MKNCHLLVALYGLVPNVKMPPTRQHLRFRNPRENALVHLTAGYGRNLLLPPQLPRTKNETLKPLAALVVPRPRRQEPAEQLFRPLELVNRCDLTVERKHNYLLRSLYFNFLTAYRSWRFRILFFVRSTRTRSFSGLKDTSFFVPLSFCLFSCRSVTRFEVLHVCLFIGVCFCPMDGIRVYGNWMVYRRIQFRSFLLRLQRSLLERRVFRRRLFSSYPGRSY